MFCLGFVLISSLNFNLNFQVNWPFGFLKCNLCALIEWSHGSLDKHDREELDQKR